MHIYIHMKVLITILEELTWLRCGIQWNLRSRLSMKCLIGHEWRGGSSACSTGVGVYWSSSCDGDGKMYSNWLSPCTLSASVSGSILPFTIVVSSMVFSCAILSGSSLGLELLSISPSLSLPTKSWWWWCSG
jgi:hypothetical protein